MNKDEFLKQIEIELKVSKNSEYTVRNYLKSNEDFLNFINKYPKDVLPEDIKLFLSEKYANRATSSVILFLAAIRYSYLVVFGFDPTPLFYVVEVFLSCFSSRFLSLVHINNRGFSPGGSPNRHTR